MKKKHLLPVPCALLLYHCGFSQNEPFDMRVVNPGYQLNSAWELTYGPDDSLWVTESNSYLVDKIDPVTGGKTRLLDLSGQRDFSSSLADWPQGGLMGMVLHPSMYSQWPAPSHPWVYLAYVYHNAGCKSDNAGCFFKTRIARYAYDLTTRKLKNPVTIIESLNGSTDHNSGRLAIGEINGTPYLFYTIGDMGTGQFKNLTRTNHAQVRDSLEGKVLRFNLDAAGDPGDAASWIPADNPYADKNGKPTAVWSWGHRNAQGLAFGTNGILYSSEQQDMSDDEVNIIEKGQNYGWPLVSGFCDGNYDGYTLANMAVVSEKQDSVNFNLHPPIFTLFTASNPGPLYGTSNSTWPTVACSSIEVYEHNIIPGWNRSLLIPSLKAGMIQRLKLDVTGTKVTDTSSIPSMRLFGKARLRDLCVSPDGLKIYISCDMSSQSATYQGKILEFTYTGPANFLSINDSLPGYRRNTHIEVFPNPASDILYIRTIKNTSHPVLYYLYDVTGKPVLSGSSNNNFFPVHTGTLSSGVYILKLYNTYRIVLDTRKIIIR